MLHCRSKLNLKANKVLDNGDIIFVVSVKLINSVNASINCIPFTIIIAPSPIIVATISGAPISDFVSIEEVTPSALKIVDLTTMDQRGDEITSGLTYAIVSAMQGDSNIDDKFEIMDSELKLKSGKTLLVGDVEFVVSAKLEGGQVVNSDLFILPVPASPPFVKKVRGQPISELASIESATSDTPKVADLVTIDQRGQIINEAKLTYAIVSAKQGSSDISVKFKLVGSELRLEANKTLEAGNIEFVVSAKLTSSSDVIINSDSFIVNIIATISKVKKIGAKEAVFVSIETSRSKALIITDLITTNQRKQVINVADLRYAIVSAEQGESKTNVKDKFEISNGLLKLKSGKTLEVGDISFIVSSQLISSSDVVPINSEPFIVTISPPIKSVKITKILFDSSKVILPIDISTNIATIVTKDKKNNIILATNLNYQIVSATKNKGKDNIDVSDKFEISNGILKLKTRKIMSDSRAKFSFVVSAQLNGAIAVDSQEFVVDEVIKLVEAWTIPIILSSLPDSNPVLVANISTKYFSNKLINPNSIYYKIISAQQGESKTNVKQKFMMHYNEIYLKSNETLEIGDISFVLHINHSWTNQFKLITFIVLVAEIGRI